MKCYYTILDSNIQRNFLRFENSFPEEILFESIQYVNLMDRLRYLAGRRLIQYALDDLQLPYGLSDIRQSKNGKPSFEGNVYFSVSHSNNLVVALFDKNQEVGVDVEFHHPIRWEDYVRSLTDKEVRIIRKSENKISMFYDIWTRKESIVKADGRGLQLELSVVQTNNQFSGIENESTKWKTRMLRLVRGYSVCVCATQIPDKIDVSQINLTSSLV